MIRSGGPSDRMSLEGRLLNECRAPSRSAARRLTRQALGNAPDRAWRPALSRICPALPTYICGFTGKFVCLAYGFLTVFNGTALKSMILLKNYPPAFIDSPYPPKCFGVTHVKDA